VNPEKFVKAPLLQIFKSAQSAVCIAQHTELNKFRSRGSQVMQILIGLIWKLQLKVFVSYRIHESTGNWWRRLLRMGDSFTSC
jgi:hypothetical protein